MNLIFLDECVLHCLDPLRANFYFARGKVKDGTHCQNSKGACIAQKCILMMDDSAKNKFKLQPS